MLVIRASAPGRCGIIGNPTDGYGGTVISCTLAERTHAEIHAHDHLHIIMGNHDLNLGSEEDFQIKGDDFDIPKLVLKHLGLTQAKLEIRCWSDIPMASGLGGSTAAIAALFGALACYKGEKHHPYLLAEKLHEIEHRLLNIQCGFQDHYMMVFGGLNYMDFRKKEDCSFIDEGVYATIESLTSYVTELPFVLAHTGVKHHSGNVHQPIRKRWLEGDWDVIDGYEKISQYARLGKKALLDKDWKELGRLMNLNHEIQRDLGGSGDFNERLIHAALEGGAQGAKLAGAGQGGTIIALATNPDPVIAALQKAGASRILFPKPSPGLCVESGMQ
jgi:galactokinase/mevalonate kinase-like predicted kinase